MVYARSTRLGILIGAGAGVSSFDFYGFRMVIYLVVVVGVFSMFLASRAHTALCMPVGIRLCGVDRFLPPRVWVPALNMLLIAFVPGVLLPLLYIGDYIVPLVLAILTCLIMPFIKMFVELPYHCQRGTADMTCYLAMETGLLVGLTTACRLADAYLLYHAVGVATTLAISFFALLAYPYYKKERVR